MILLRSASQEFCCIVTKKKSLHGPGSHPRGRCYDYNFLRFLTIFGEKIGVFLKNQCYDQHFA
jgi:hypothetical protein